jgi:NAD(P)H-flavin reductase
LIDHQKNALVTWIDGPYGQSVDLSSYNQVLMVATSIGIAAQISYIKELLEVKDRGKSHIRSIFVAWEVGKESMLPELGLHV